MTATLPLTTATLAHHAARLAVPSYDRAALTPAVVHLSVGSFHRSHQAAYLDALARTGDTGWGVVGVGLRHHTLRDMLATQDGLYTLVERWHDGDRARVIGVMTRYLFAPDDPGTVLDALADERTRLVTLTVTGAGYKLHPSTGELDLEDEELRADLAGRAGHRAPRSALGLLVEALDRRRRAGRAPFTVLSCDNMPANGQITRRVVLSWARRRDERLADWIEEAVAFPSSMVDRITPKTTPEDRAFVARAFGVADRAPVITEPFSQWIIEDEFCNGRPPLEDLGVQFVDDVRPYALTKTRLLNAGHCALGHLAQLAGHDRTDEAVADPVFGEYVDRLMGEDVSPLLPSVPGLDLDDYRRVLLERLANPAIPDQLERLTRGASTKMPCHVLSSIQDARALGRPHRFLTLAVAGWFRYLRGADDTGRPLLIDDPLAQRLRALAAVGGSDPRPLLAERSLFGWLGEDPGFGRELAGALATMDVLGTRGAVEVALAAGGHPVVA